MKLRKRHFCGALSVLLIFAACATQKKATVYHEFPAAMLPDVKAQYVQHWEKGKILYGITCAQCHNVMVKRKETIPDFSDAQLTGYNLRQGNSKHEGSLGDTQVSAEDLALIYVFLTYKNRSGIAVQHTEDDGKTL